MQVFSSLQRWQLKPVKSTQMNQEFEDWLTLWIPIGLCLLLHANRKMKEENDKDAACVKIEIPLTWDPVASDAWASLRMHLLSRPSYFRVQLYVYWLRDPRVIFQVCVGPDDCSDSSNCIMASYRSSLLLWLKQGNYQKLKEIWSKEVKGDSVIRNGTIEDWGECREGERKQVVQQQFQVQNALGKVTCRILTSCTAFWFFFLHEQAN